MAHDFWGDSDLDVSSIVEVPSQIDVLPDGREVIVIGDVERCKEYTHPQGDNPFGFKGTCGLCSVEGIARQFGIDVTEADVVARAIDHGLCNTDGPPSEQGGTRITDQVQLLDQLGVPSHHETGQSLSDLAAHLEHGHGIIVEANAGELWGDASYYGDGSMNHAVVATGVARDSATGEIVGFYINDTGTGDAGRFVPADTMREAWESAGGNCVVTDITAPDRR